MKILAISHNVFDKSNNMGKTLTSQFNCFSKDQVAQLFFTKSTPNFDHCNEYFCIPDGDVFRSVFTRRAAGFEVDLKDTCRNEKKQNVQLAIRKRGRRPSTYLIRNAIWALGKWKSQRLNQWLDSVNPDVIYYASGDYSFSYKVAMYIAKKRNIPIIIGCYDDFYINKSKTLNPLYHLFYHGLMKSAKKLFKTASCFTAISQMMTKDYEALFNKKGYTMYIPSEIENSNQNPRQDIIFYAGNLGYGRAEQLVLLGRAIKSLDRSDISHIDVYSSEIREELVGLMCEENGIVFHGKTSPKEVEELMLNSKYVIHTESFDPQFKQRVAYSISTKISDCLACGACIIAFGPKEVASINYLDKDGAAFVISDKSQLKKQLSELFDNEDLVKAVAQKAQLLSRKNHNNEKNFKMLKEIVSDTIC